MRYVAALEPNRIDGRRGKVQHPLLSGADRPIEHRRIQQLIVNLMPRFGVYRHPVRVYRRTMNNQVEDGGCTVEKTHTVSFAIDDIWAVVSGTRVSQRPTLFRINTEY